MQRNNYWKLAWLCFLLAPFLRWSFFSGFGLGDDSNELATLISFADNMRLNPEDFAHYRVFNVLLRGGIIRLYGVSELGFILPILVFSLLLHGLCLFFARDLAGERAAFFTSLLFLVTPFETLCATSNIPDYFHAFFGTASLFFLNRALQGGRFFYAYLAALSFFLGLSNRMAVLILLPVFAFLNLLTIKRMGIWLRFWLSMSALFGLVCYLDYLHSGSWKNWFFKNSGGGGVDVTDVLGYVLMVYPRYLLSFDEFGSLMFGSTGWLCLAGILFSLVRVLRKRAVRADYALLIGFFLYFGLFEFMPHRLTLEAYYSHSRIFRYMPQIAPIIYFGAAYFLDQLLASCNGPKRKTAFATILSTCLLVNVLSIPSVTYASRNGNADIRELVKFLKENSFKEGTHLYTDYWRLAAISGNYHPHYRIWPLHGVTPDDDDEKRKFLSGIKEGIVITGGATLPWYAGIDLIISLKRLKFEPPENWKVIFQYNSTVERWRMEPLRVWRVEKELAPLYEDPPRENAPPPI